MAPTTNFSSRTGSPNSKPATFFKLIKENCSTLTTVACAMVRPEVLQKLNAGERVDQSLIYFRTAATIETAAPRLQWLARSVFVCVGERYPTEVVVRFYRVL